VIPGAQAKTFRVYAIYDPAYTTPWLLATPLALKAATVRAMYQDRLAGRAGYRFRPSKWLVRIVSFVHADESIQRLPELALLAGSILSYLAATVPAASHRFLGSPTQAYPRPLPPHADGQAISAKLPIA